mgnify:CR=1 FL=1
MCQRWSSYSETLRIVEELYFIWNESNLWSTLMFLDFMVSLIYRAQEERELLESISHAKQERELLLPKEMEGGIELNNYISS